ncbi:MAG TPA: acyl-ACP thioesterase domain-containing protein [Solirubrobacterales bacterium]|nr:acyl-ACP thioesterase domain-containing protein [Solirubrobacterales bacterium]
MSDDPAGRKFTDRHRVGAADVAADGGAHVFAVARWLQETAFADGLDSGFGADAFWIIRRLRLDIRRLPSFPEELTVTTWCSGKAKSVAERTTTIAGDGGADVTAEAIWVHVDPQTRLPARLPAEFERIYGPSAAGRKARASLRHPAEPPAGAERFDWWFGRSLIDLAGHVSNLWYWQPAEEHLDLPTAAAPTAVLEAEFRSGIGHGPATLHRADGMLWISDAAGTVAGTIAAPAP